MSNRTANCTSAIFVGLLTGLVPTAIPSSAARAAEDCLSRPRNHTPIGSHWYYRTDHITKRQCWYLAEERERTSRASAHSLPSVPGPVSPRQQTPAEASIADARAEFSLPQRIEAPNRNSAFLAPSDPPAVENSRSAYASEETTPRSVFTSRWPEQLAANLPVAPVQDKAVPVRNAEPTPISPPSITSTGQVVAADISATMHAYSAQLRLAAFWGALALAGLAGSKIFRFVYPRGARANRIRASRGAIWPPIDDSGLLISSHRAMDRYARRGGLTRNSDPINTRNARVTEFFDHMSKRTPT
jgi:hypothetical protein